MAKKRIFPENRLSFLRFSKVDNAVLADLPVTDYYDPVLPALPPPQNLVATAFSPNSIGLQWDNVAGDPVAYSVQHSDTGVEGTFSLAGVTMAGVLSFVHTGLASAQRKYYRVRSIGIPASEYSDTTNATTFSEFVMTIDTNIAGGTTNLQYDLFFSITLDATVDWGDGSTDTYVSGGSKVHDYASAGIYTIKVWGLTYNIQMNNSLDRLKATQVSKWGDVFVDKNAYAGCNFAITAIDSPRFVSGQGVFASFGQSNINLDNWDYEEYNVMAFSSMFKDSNIVNLSLLNWKIRGTAYEMVMNCGSFNGLGVESWDVSELVTSERMFLNCTNFNGNVSGWDVSSITNAYNFFAVCSNFNQDVSSWDTSGWQDFSQVFYSCSSFDQSLSNWDFTSATTLFDMLFNCGMSSANYNGVLAKLRSDAGAGSGITNGMEFGADGLVATGQGVIDKQWLIDNTGMIITDATP